MKDNHNHSPAKHRELQMSDLDFNPEKRLRVALRGRAVIEGITIDPPKTYINDDGVDMKRRDGDKCYIATSVIDLPSIIPDGSGLERLAAVRKKESFVRAAGVQRIWPVEFLKEYASMHGGTTRPAITFKMFLDEDRNVESYKIVRTAFHNKGEHSDGSLSSYADFSAQDIDYWRRLSRDLYQKRCRDLAHRFDKAIDPAALPDPRGGHTNQAGDMQDGELIVHEVMRLTNRVATEFLRANRLTVPFKAQSANIEPVSVSADYGFDALCNRLCVGLIENMVQEDLPYVHLNSPMRRYTDYLALKVLGRHLAGLPEDPKLREEIRNIRNSFNRAADGMGALLQPAWAGQWRYLLRGQQDWHPFRSIQQGQKHVSSLVDLKELCAARHYDRPLVVEREITVQGAKVYLAGIRVSPEDSRDVDGWAFAHGPDLALNKAAARILKKMSPCRPDIAPGGPVMP